MTKVKKAKTRKRRSKAETFALFLELRKEKASIKEVAKAMGVTSNYLYKTIIPELAEYMHVDRNTFLFAPQCSTRNAKTQENVKVETETVETETIEAETVVTGTVEEDTVEEEKPVKKPKPKTKPKKVKKKKVKKQKKAKEKKPAKEAEPKAKNRTGTILNVVLIVLVILLVIAIAATYMMMKNLGA